MNSCDSLSRTTRCSRLPQASHLRSLAFPFAEISGIILAPVRSCAQLRVHFASLFDSSKPKEPGRFQTAHPLDATTGFGSPCPAGRLDSRLHRLRRSPGSKSDRTPRPPLTKQPPEVRMPGLRLLTRPTSHY